MPSPEIPQLQDLLNRSTANWQADSNTLTEDRNDQERQTLLGVTIPRQALARLATAPRSATVIAGLPAAIDWRDVGGRNHISPVKDQGGCGSCVSFCTCSAIESAVSIATGDLVDLSEADLHFCSNHGASCGGWWPSDALAEAARRGVPLDSEFPYSTAFDASGAPSCKISPHRDDRLYRPSGTATLSSTAERKQWLASRGPVCAVIHVYDDFFAYANGVYRHLTGAHAGYHCIEVIGYSDPDQCWIAKNSWGPGWGESGFFRIGYGECGIDDTSNDRDPDGSMNRFPMYGVDGVSVPGGWRGFDLAGAGSVSASGGITAVSRIPTSMEPWWIADNGSVQGAYWYEGNPWGRYELAPAGSASTTGGIASASRIPNSLEVWWVGANGSVQGAYWYDGNPWGRYELAPAGSASTTCGVSGVSRIPNSLEVWWIADNGSVQGAYWYEGIPWGRYELAPAGSASPTGGIASASRIPNSLEVWWVGANGSVQGAYWYDGNPWGRYELAPAGSASTTGGISGVSRIPNSLEAWWTGGNGSLQGAYWYDGNQWGRYELAPGGSASPSGAVSGVSRVPNSLELWWTGGNGSLQAAYWYDGGQWTRYELAPGGAASSTGGVAAVSRIPNSMELWWTGADGALKDNYWYP